MIDNIDIRMKLLAGLPLEIKGVCKVCPLTLREISTINYTTYQSLLINLIADIKDFKLSENVDTSNISFWDILISNMVYADDDYRNAIMDGLTLFLRTDNIFFDTKNLLFFVDGNEINKDVFEKIREYLRYINCINLNKKDEFKPANKKAEEIMKKIMKGRMAVNKKNQIEFDDLISSYCEKNNSVNIMTVWDMTLYQFNFQFSRMQMLEGYQVGIQQLLAGAKSEEVKLKHYVRPISVGNSDGF